MLADLARASIKVQVHLCTYHGTNRASRQSVPGTNSAFVDDGGAGGLDAFWGPGRLRINSATDRTRLRSWQDPGSAPFDEHASVGDQPNRLGKRTVLFGQNSLRERFLSVALQDRHRALKNDRPAVDLIVDEMDRAPGDLHPVAKRIRLGVKGIAKGGQKRGVNIDDPVVEGT